MSQSKNKEVKINTIELVIGNEKIKLSLDQAKELKKILDELFVRQTTKEYITVPYYPYYIKYDYPHKYWEIMCEDTSATKFESVTTVSSLQLSCTNL